MQLSGDECIEMKAIDMWERDVTRDGRVTTGKSNVGIEANRAVVASTRRRSAFLCHLDTVYGLSSTHRAEWAWDRRVSPRRGALQEWAGWERTEMSMCINPYQWWAMCM